MPQRMNPVTSPVCTAGNVVGWPGRTRTGALPLRGRALYPTELLANGGPGRTRTGVAPERIPLCRRLPNRSVTGPERPRLDSNQRSPPSEGGALSNFATRTCVAEPGVEPGVPEGATVLQTAERPSLTSAGEDDGTRTRNGPAHNRAPQPFGSPSVDSAGVEPAASAV
jgi:hypothetical protein